jgi:hypothetical protein
MRKAQQDEERLTTIQAEVKRIHKRLTDIAPIIQAGNEAKRLFPLTLSQRSRVHDWVLKGNSGVGDAGLAGEPFLTAYLHLKEDALKRWMDMGGGADARNKFAIALYEEDEQVTKEIEEDAAIDPRLLRSTGPHKTALEEQETELMRKLFDRYLQPSSVELSLLIPHP